MKKTMIGVLLLFCISAFSGEKVSAFSVVNGGVGQCSIEIPANADHVTKKAAEELQLWVKEITGAELPITASAPANRNKIVLALNSKDPKLAGNDGYAVKNTGKEFRITASCPRGLLNGVYHILYRNTDIIWARPEAEVGTFYSKNKNLAFKDRSGYDIPVFVQRRCYANSGIPADQVRNGQWLIRNGANYFIERHYTEVPKYGTILEYGGGHNLTNGFLKESIYFKSHPEYYALVDGVRRPPSFFPKNEGTQLCYTNKEMTEEFKKCLDRVISEHPESSIFRVMPEDNYNLCTCPECMAPIRLPDGTLLDGRKLKNRSPEWKAWRCTQFFLWYNEIARFVKKKYPDKQLLCYAYLFTEYGPKIKIEDNVIIHFFPIYRNAREPITGKTNEAVLKNLNGWLAQSKQLVWNEYYGINQEYPRPIDRTVFNDLVYLHDRGLNKMGSYFITDSAKDTQPGVYPFYLTRGNRIWDLGAPYFWSSMQAAWNPYRKVEDVRREYYERVFGKKAAPEVEAFYNELEKAWATGTRPSVWRDDSRKLWLDYQKSGVHADCMKHYEKALSLIENPKARRLLERMRKYFVNKDGLTSKSARPVKIPKAGEKVEFQPGFQTGVWKNALEIKGLYTPAGKKEKYPTTVKFLHDGENLYAALHAERPDIAKAFSVKKPHCQTEAFSLFVQTDDNLYPGYVRLLVDPKDWSWGMAEGDFDYKKLKWKHQAAWQENSWDALIIVPLNIFSRNMKIACFRHFVATRHPDRGVGLKDSILGVPETFAPVTLEK